MEEKNSFRLLKCSTGDIVEIDYEVLLQMISDCEKEAEKAGDVRKKIRNFLELADTCRTSGHPYYATILYKKALRLSVDDDYENISMRNKDYAFMAARALVSEWKKITGDDRFSDILDDVRDSYEDLYYLTHYLD